MGEKVGKIPFSIDTVSQVFLSPLVRERKNEGV